MIPDEHGEDLGQTTRSRPHAGTRGARSARRGLAMCRSRRPTRSRWQPSHRRPLRRATATPPNVLAQRLVAVEERRGNRLPAGKHRWRAADVGSLGVDRPPSCAASAASATATATQESILVSSVGGSVVETFLRLEVLRTRRRRVRVTTLDRGDLVHQRLRLPWREHGAQLLLETNLFGAEVGTGRLPRIRDLRASSPSWSLTSVARASPSGEGAVGGGDRVVLGQRGSAGGASWSSLVSVRCRSSRSSRAVMVRPVACRRPAEAQHSDTYSVDRIVGSGAFGSSTSGGIVVAVTSS